MRGSCPRAGAIGGEAVAGKRGSFHPTAQIAVGRAESRSKAREGCAWRPLPINRHPVRRVAEAGSRLFVAPAGHLVQKGGASPAPAMGGARERMDRRPNPYRTTRQLWKLLSFQVLRHRASADRQAESRQEKV